MLSQGACHSRRIVAAILAAASLWCVPTDLARAQDPDVRLRVARHHMANLRLDRALKEVRRVLEADPSHLEGWKLKAEVMLRLADLDGALEASMQAARLAPEDPELLSSIGDLLLRRNDRLDEALAIYARVLKLDPSSARTFVAMGSIHERREQWDQAAAAYRSALAIDPNLVRARSSLGAVLFKTGHFDQASRELRKSIELSPRDLRSHVFLGLSQNHLGHYDIALDELKEAVLIDPHSANQLIGVREQGAQFKRLIDLFMAAYEEDPREAGRSYDLAVIYFYAQDYDSSWRHLVRAEQLRYPIPIEMKEVVYSRRRLRSRSGS